MLTTTDRRRYQRRLREERDRAMRIIQQSRNEQASDDTDGDLSDRASLEADRELDQLVSTRESDAVAAIDAALRVMANSPAEYGMCRVCHEPIARERLDVLPWALTCERHADSN